MHEKYVVNLILICLIGKTLFKIYTYIEDAL